MVDPSNNRFTVFGRRVSNQRRRMLEGLTPTFDEFVQYLLTLPPAEMDEHWRPMYIDCNACTNSFSLIFKVETMDQDRDYLLSLLLGVNSTGVSLKAELDQIWRRWTNSVGKDTLPASAWKTRHEYFSQVSQQNLRALYELYEPDFLMFGYSPDKYLDMTG
ncbi:unnamed protein product [Allacma fusca]|uniref:Carbohydrate sulfotransferase n=2 Tax=Allacma fusca TaxID=39272 RepID=A0A8J2JZH0_9HEXA|nr:unnamed protein product [Allacma fusca]